MSNNKHTYSALKFPNGIRLSAAVPHYQCVFLILLHHSPNLTNVTHWITLHIVQTLIHQLQLSIIKGPLYVIENYHIDTITHWSPFRKMPTCLSSQVFYFVFLITFSYVVLMELHSHVTPEEWLVVLTVFSLATEEIRQVPTADIRLGPTRSSTIINTWAKKNWHLTKCL